MTTLPLAVMSAAGSALNTLTQPMLSGPFLAFLEYCPSHIMEEILHFKAMGYSLQVQGTTTMLRALFGIGLLKTLNRMMNAWATTNWHIAPIPGWRWDGEIAVVTGGCRGIGKSIVLGLVEKGVRVAILDVIELPLDLEQEALVAYWKCDITSSAAVAEAAAAIRKTMGQPSILINNAGIGTPNSILDSSDAQIQRVTAVNLVALFITTKEFLPHMIMKNKGHIVTVASITSLLGMPRTADYSATKAGALSFHESLVSELKSVYKSPGVLATVVHPFFVSTNMTTTMGDTINDRARGILQPEDIAGPVVKQILSRRGGQIIVPGRLSFLTALRGWPNWFQEFIRDSLATPQ